MPQDPLELNTRRRIYEEVRKHPGTHMRELQRRLAMSLGTLEYHLHVMVREELLSTREDGRYVRYYASAQIGRREKDVLALLRQEIPRRVCAHLLLQPDAAHKDLLVHFAIAPSTLSFHLKKLVVAELVDARKDGRETRYRVRDPALVGRCLVTYKESFLDDVVDRFAAAWLDVGAGLESPAGPGQAPGPPEGTPATEPEPAAPPPKRDLQDKLAWAIWHDAGWAALA